MFMEKTVSVVVPAHNEEKLIGRVIETMPECVDKIIIVNDCSRDKTEAAEMRQIGVVEAAGQNGVSDQNRNQVIDRQVCPVRESRKEFLVGRSGPHSSLGLLVFGVSGAFPVPRPDYGNAAKLAPVH